MTHRAERGRRGRAARRRPRPGLRSSAVAALVVVALAPDAAHAQETRPDERAAPRALDAFGGLVSRTASVARYVPARPRLGDLLVVYVREPRAHVVRAGLRVFDRTVEAFRVSDAELRAVVAVPIDAMPGLHTLELELPGERRALELAVDDRAFETDRLTVDKRFTRRPDRALARRLEAEERAWRALFEAPPTEPIHVGRFVRPVPGRETAPYGVRRTFNGKTRSRHYGLDLDGATGDPVLAIGDGRVVMSAMRWASGGTVVVDHGGGLFTAYFHLSAREVRPGQRVVRGQRVGAVGATGRVTGPHLHLSVLARMAGPLRVDGWFVDPAPVLGRALDGDRAFTTR
jgi:murein DD-endopeptidase MepM/ murein hydrolase activator NlpD